MSGTAKQATIRTNPGPAESPAVVIGIDAEGKSLETVTKPLTSVAD